MQILKGKNVAENITKNFANRIETLEQKGVHPHIAILGISGDNASEVYIKKIEKNCDKYKIGFTLKMAHTSQEFKTNFESIKNNKEITGIMFQQPLPKELLDLINEVPAEKDIEGIGINNMGRLFCGKNNALIPCTSKAVIETIDYYNINLAKKKVVIVGRSNIVGKPLIPQILAKDASVTICHSKTKALKQETLTADIIIMAIGKSNFLNKDFIKKGAILIDVGINFENGKIVGDIDFESIKNTASMCSPVPGGIGIVTNAVLIDNIIKSCEYNIL